MRDKRSDRQTARQTDSKTFRHDIAEQSYRHAERHSDGLADTHKVSMFSSRTDIQSDRRFGNHAGWQTDSQTIRQFVNGSDGWTLK